MPKKPELIILNQTKCKKPSQYKRFLTLQIATAILQLVSSTGSARSNEVVALCREV
jgi:hypothetical protein